MLLKRLNKILLFFVFFLIPNAVLAAPAKITLPNPLGTTNILDLGARLIQAGLGIAGSLALLFFIYGGFLWLTSGGSPDKIKKGRDVFLWSVVGLVIIFSSYIMVDFVIKAITKGATDTQTQCNNQSLEEQGKCMAYCDNQVTATTEVKAACVQDCLKKATEASEKCKVK